MQKTNFLHAVACGVAVMITLLAGPLHAQSTDSVETVDALLKAENKAATDRLRSIAEASAPPKPLPVSKKMPAGPASVQVRGVYGVDSNLRADITYDGMPYLGVGRGDRVGPCEVSIIQGTSVGLQKTGFGFPSTTGLAPGESLVLDKSSDRSLGKIKKSETEAKRACPAMTVWTPSAAPGLAMMSSSPPSFPSASGPIYPVPSLISRPMTSPMVFPAQTK